MTLNDAIQTIVDHCSYCTYSCCSFIVDKQEKEKKAKTPSNKHLFSKFIVIGFYQVTYALF